MNRGAQAAFDGARHVGRPGLSIQPGYRMLNQLIQSPEKGEMTQTALCHRTPAPTFFSGAAADCAPGSDFAIAGEAARGATEALGELYVRHRGCVYSVCLRMTGDPAEAEDLTQDVFVQLIRAIGSFRGQSRFTTWLHRLAVNQVLMHFRRAKARRGEKGGEHVEVEKLPAREGLCPEGAQVLDRIDLEAALAQLPAGYQAAFLLFDVGGYSHEEIAGMFGFAVGTSKSQLHKARKKLRRLLGPGGPGRVKRARGLQES